MPTEREREYYRMGFADGMKQGGGRAEVEVLGYGGIKKVAKRKLSAWNKFVKANSKKPRFRYARSNKINLKKMAIAFRKTPAGKKKRR